MSGSAAQLYEEDLRPPYLSIGSIYLWNAVKLKIGPGDLN
jgi:hypothetical protein